jgi:hypothetical protein
MQPKMNATHRDIKQKLFELFQLIKHLLDDLEDICLELITANEFGIALELIYDYFDENEILISEQIYFSILELVSLMELTGVREWDSLFKISE